MTTKESNIESFISAYSKCVAGVRESELREFFKILEVDGYDAEYLNMCSGSHIMDCWLLWNEARNMRIMQ
jgi:hypothetical protein